VPATSGLFFWPSVSVLLAIAHAGLRFPAD